MSYEGSSIFMKIVGVRILEKEKQLLKIVGVRILEKEKQLKIMGVRIFATEKPINNVSFFTWLSGSLELLTIILK